MTRQTSTLESKLPPRNAEKILEELRAQKFRITKVRSSLLEILCDSKQPMSAPQILKALATRRIAVNKTTVYRELDFLLLHRIVAEIDILDGTKRYEVVPPDHHHHHLVCTACGNIQCVEMQHDLDALEKKIRSSHQFKVDSHVLEFFGRCSTCM